LLVRLTGLLVCSGQETAARVWQQLSLQLLYELAVVLLPSLLLMLMLLKVCWSTVVAAPLVLRHPVG
jgi:ABC-type uncharacterized transport system involved in gliding motility auxiliary subunit